MVNETTINAPQTVTYGDLNANRHKPFLALQGLHLRLAQCAISLVEGFGMSADEADINKTVGRKFDVG